MTDNTISDEEFAALYSKTKTTAKNTVTRKTESSIANKHEYNRMCDEYITILTGLYPPVKHETHLCRRKGYVYEFNEKSGELWGCISPEQIDEWRRHFENTYWNSGKSAIQKLLDNVHEMQDNAALGQYYDSW